MNTATKAAAALLATTAMAQAGGVERSNQSVAILFEEGTYAELSFSLVSPDVTGVQLGTGTPSGDIGNGFLNYAFRIRQDLGGPWSMGLIAENHIGADVTYNAGTGYAISPSRAAIRGDSLAAILRYEFDTGASLYGGARASRAEGMANLTVPGFGNYTLDTEADTAIGYLVGVSYEIPEIALRVNLTYNSEYTHTFSSSETGLGPPLSSSFDTTIPQSLHLEAQSGIAEDTLLFGSIRWVDWTEFDISPTRYSTAGGGALGSLVDYDSDTITYVVGVGRRFSDAVSGAASITYEAEQNDLPGANLGPTDGRIALGLGGTYTTETGVEISGGVQYSWLGNTVTSVGRFEDNTSVAAGITIGMNF